MVKLRLKRMGRKNIPFYRVVVVDSRKKRDGAYIEALGFYSPKSDEVKVKIDQDVALKWLRMGAQPTDTVKSLLRQEGVLKVWDEEKKAAAKA